MTPNDEIIGGGSKYAELHHPDLIDRYLADNVSGFLATLPHDALDLTWRSLAESANLSRRCYTSCATRSPSGPPAGAPN
jgi:hypothetical protein